MKNKKTNNRYSFLIFVVLVFVCIIVLLSSIDKNIIFEMVSTPRTRSRPITAQAFNNEPILITPSNVTVIQTDICSDEQETYSPDLTRRPSEHTFRVINSDNRTPRNQTVLGGYVSNHKRSEFRSDGEMLCCKIFEELVEEPVEINIRPNFLKNPKTNRNLELDCFYRKKSIAIEYNGSYHYRYEPTFHKDGNKSFLEVRERDKLKKELCVKNGIRLICVPWTVDCGEKTKDGKWKYIKRTLEQREKCLKCYIEPFLYEYLQEYEIEKY